MKKSELVICVMIVLTLGLSAQVRNNSKNNDFNNLRESKSGLKLIYYSPAQKWSSQALPIGNGHMGGMIFGGVIKDQIQYNEKTLWSGGPGAWSEYQGGNKDGAALYLPKMREVIAKKDYKAAEKIMEQHCLGNPKAFGAYQDFGNIYLDFSKTIQNSEGVTNYYRELDLDKGLVRVGFDYNGHKYTREYFCSYPDRVMVIQLKSTNAAGLSFSINADCAHSDSKILYNKSNNTITTVGKVADNKMGFESNIKVRANGGKLSVQGDKIVVENADSVTLIMAAATEYVNSHPTYTGGNPQKIVSDILSAVNNKSQTQLKENHLKDYQKLYSRVKINLNNSSFGTSDKKSVASQATDALLKDYKVSGNTDLETLMFQYGRYLLIASSRAGSLPANLQGVWNNMNIPPWNCDYHFDINIQMNYFSSEVTNLTECSEPLVDYINSLRAPGRITAEKHHGVIGGGWVVHPMNNAFGFTASGWETYWAWAPFNAAWICQNIWAKYKFHGDKEYLRTKIYPIIKEQAQFWQKSLVPDEDGYLISNPAVSPEQLPISDGPTSDQAMCYELFSDVIEASQILKIDASFRKELIKMRDKLLPLKIGSWGQLQEWKYDWDKKDNKHRHVSHLVTVYQGERISPYTTPELAQAARVSLQARDDVKGDVHGWSLIQRVGLWARLLEPEKAYAPLNTLIKGYLTANLFSLTGGVFQIDANLGVPGVMSELLLQSHLGNINLLPALPKAWPSGTVSGLCARGGFEVDMKWDNYKLKKTAILSKLGNECVVKTPMLNSNFIIVNAQTGKPVRFKKINDTIKFKTTAGSTYLIDFQ